MERSPSSTSPTVASTLVAAERRCHSLWSAEPIASLERRRELMDELGAVDGEIEAISLDLLRASGDTTSERELHGRLVRVNDRLDAIEDYWPLPAA